jgi:RHS repeat-associated protein
MGKIMDVLDRTIRTFKVAGLCVIPALLAAGATDSTSSQAKLLSSTQSQSGQSATLLPDGSRLLLGGRFAGAATAQAMLVDEDGQTRVLASGLSIARANQSATVTPDGTVLVVGGQDSARQPIADIERYHGDTRTIENLGDLGLPARTGHTTTLLTDGTLLIVGGTDGSALVRGDAELVDPVSLKIITDITLSRARSGHSARLLPSGDVLIWGGKNQNGEPVPSAELYRATTRQFSEIDTPTAASLIGQGLSKVSPALAASAPENGASDVSVNARLVLRFTKPLAPQSVSGETVTLLGPSGPLDASVVAAEGGLLAFITPKRSLLPATSYTLFVQGPHDLTEQHPLPFTSVTFQTAAILATPQIHLPTPSNDKKDEPSDYDGELWIPAANNLNGVWRSGHGRHAPDAKDLPKAPSGITAVSGVVLRLNGEPLANVTLSIGNQKVLTGANGKFLLSNVPAGNQTLVIDGMSANTGQKQYGRYEYLATLEPKKTNALPFVIWMTRLDTKDAIQIPSPTTTETVVKNPHIPGLELQIPAGSVIRDSNGNNVTNITMTEIPVDQPPFPLPNHWVPVYFTIQPGGAHIEGLTVKSAVGARLIYPNFGNSRPGTRIDFWNYDPALKGWYVYGQGTVSVDGKQITPDPGVVIYEFTGAMVALPSTAPTVNPVAACGSGGGDASSPNSSASAGDPVDCFTGLFTMSRTDLGVNDVWPLAVNRVYRPLDSTSRAFGVGANLGYDLFIMGSTNPWTYVYLILPDGTQIYYPRTSSGTSFSNAVFQTQTPGAFFGSTIRYAGGSNYYWTLTLPNGTAIGFPEAEGASVARCAAARGMTDRYGNALTFVRDSNCNLTSVASPNGHKLTFAYDASNRITQVTDDTGRSATYSYNTAGTLASATDPAGNTEKYGYDTSNRLVTITDKRGNVSLTNTYNSSSQVTQQTYADQSTSSFSYTANSSGVTTQMNYTDERGNVRQVQFNGAGYPTSITRGFGSSVAQTTTFTRDPNTNLASSVTDPLGRVTTYQYNGNGSVTQLTLLSGTSGAVGWSISYEPNYGQLSSITDPLGHTASYTFDSYGNPVTFADAMGDVINLAYNAAGQLISSTRHAGSSALTTSYAYNGGVLSGVTDSLNRTTSIFNDALGRAITIQDPMGNQSHLAYDLLDDVVQVTDPLGHSVALGYDPNQNLLTSTDANNVVQTYTYDPRNRRHTYQDPSGKLATYNFDGMSNLTSQVDRKSQTTGVAYDALNRPTLVTYQDGSTITITWDAGNRATKFVDSINGTISRTYDLLDRLTQETTPQAQIGYTYDAANRRQTMTVSGQATTNYTFDNANRLTQIAQGTVTVGFGYDTASRRTSVTLPNGIIGTYNFDAADELTAITYASGSTQVGNVTYGYDLDGRRTSAGGTLAGFVAPSAVASVYNGVNRLTSYGGTALTYDADGNLTAYGSTTYTWNARNQLTATSSGSATIAYDALGRRVSETVGGKTTTTVYDGFNVATQAGTPVIGSDRIDEIWARLDSTSATTSFLRDGINSAVALTNNAGAVSGSYAYSPYGTSQGSGSTTTSQQYTGRDNDGTGLYYYRARYYSPQLGRFVSEDPLGLGGGTNFYAYAGGNPISNIDPSGLLFTSVDAACAISPDFCAEIMGQIVQSHGAIVANETGNQCAAEEADRVANGFRTIGAIAGIVQLGGAAKGVVNVLEEAGGAIHLTVDTSKGTVEVISNIAQEGETLTLSGLHITGPGAGTLGIAGINELKQAAAEFGASRGASQVIIQGAVRTTGRNVGSLPSPIVISVP